MSNIAFRDASVIIIETGRTSVRAGLGLHDLLRTPYVEILARVGLRRSLFASRANGNGGDVHMNGSSSRAPSSPKVNDYLVGKQLDDALLAGEDIVVSWPFADGEIHDFLEAEAIWKYILFNQLGRKRTQNESPALLTFIHGLSRDTHEQICQTFFERFNIAALSILERPLAQLYAANSLSGLVVDIGRDKTDITPIYDCTVLHNCCETIPLGLSDCELYLAHLWKSNQSIVGTLSPPETPLEPAVLHDTLVELARHVWKEGLIKVPSDGETALEANDEELNIAAVVVAGKEKSLIEAGMKKRANAKASAAEQARAKEIEALDLQTVQFRDLSITMGRERHRFCEPLFDPTLLDGVEGIPEKSASDIILPIHDGCGQAMTRTDVDTRLAIWNGLFVTGDAASLVKGIGSALQSRLAPYILSNPDQQSDVQAKYIRVLHVPDYFAEYREKGDGYAAFLGASVVAKIIFSDPHGKNFVSKGDYTTKGPRAILEMSPNML